MEELVWDEEVLMIVASVQDRIWVGCITFDSNIDRRHSIFNTMYSLSLESIHSRSIAA